MDEENKSTVNTIGDNQEQKQQKKLENQNNDRKEKQRHNVISFIKKHFSIIWKIVLIILIILFIIGILQILITMPGLIIGKLKEFGSTFLSGVGGWFTGDNISAKISKEDQIAIAQYVQDMGYDIVGYGFGDAEYEKDNDLTRKKGIENGKIVNIKNLDGKNYLKAYLVQNEAIYTLSIWSLGGFFRSLFEGGAAEDYSKGMIEITIDGRELPPNGQFDRVSIDRQRKILRIATGADRSSVYVSNGAFFYFDMSSWTSRYGKPLELFLALHLSTMMPDLAYDLATAECFNTKVNIDLQTVEMLYTVSFAYNGNTIQQEEIEKTYLKARWGIETQYTQTGFETFYNLIQEYTTTADYSENKKIDLTYIENRMLGEEDEDEDKDEHTYSEEEKPESQWQSVINASNLNGLSVEKFKSLVKLCDEGKRYQKIYWPRIKEVKNHWFYEKVTYEYGRASSAKKRIKYEPDDDTNPLYQVDGITLNATLSSAEGVYYQLTEPEAIGPNDAIIALFKGNNSNYPFTGEYYRYDGTRETAQKIAQRDPSIKKEPVTFYDINNNNSYKNAYSAFAILENSHTQEAEESYRDLKELLIELEYFTEDELKDPITQVLDWFMPDNAIKENVTKDINKYGIIVKKSIGKSINMPGDGKIIAVDEDTVTLEFSILNSKKLNELESKYTDKLYYIDDKSIIDMQMVISGINPSVSVGQTVQIGQKIGSAIKDDVQVYMKYRDGSIVDDVTKYMDVILPEGTHIDESGKTNWEYNEEEEGNE